MLGKDECVAVLMGGPGSERRVSLASGAAVLRALQSAGLQAVAVELTEAKLVLPPGCRLAFNVIHGTYGEDGRLQAELQQLGCRYTGAGVESSALAFDKNRAKERFVAAGVPTPRSQTLELSQEATASWPRPQLSLPLVVKPPCEGSSVGVHVVRDEAEWEPALRDAARYGRNVLVESFIKGRELTVAVLDDVALPVVEIVPREGFYNMENKYPWLSGGAGSEYHCPALLTEEATARVQQAALAAHRALGVEVYSRVDVLLDDEDQPYVLEVNTLPGMTETSLLPKAAAQAGLGFEELCLKIAALSWSLQR